MDEKTLQNLEFEKIKNMLLHFVVSPLGKEKVENLYPSTNFSEILTLAEETREAREILESNKNIPLREFKDIRPYLQRVELSAILEAEELLEISNVLEISENIKNFFKEKNSPLLCKICSFLFTLSELRKEITNTILPNGEINENVSPALKILREEISHLNRKIYKKLEEIIYSPDFSRMLQEQIITLRENRYVIPVKSEFRKEFPGIIQGESASGATFFMEPIAIMELNNELKRIQEEEKREIIRILKKLTQKVKENRDKLYKNFEILGEIDFIVARGKLGKIIKGITPKFTIDGHIDLKKMRHPLLGDSAVGIDINLGDKFDILVISGANTGGKTVTLKTVGLLILMAQSGLQIPADEGSQIRIFKKIFADIGDEQSIEQNLSTFSSHIGYISKILPEVDQDTLVILDELGAGTNPEEGSALAQAILKYLKDKKAKVLTTTHYTAVKNYAYSEERVENASVEFDILTLQPTYKIIIGIPGVSNALLIAEKLGIPKEIISNSYNLMGKKEIDLEKLISDITKKEIQKERETEMIKMIREDIEALREEKEKELKKLEEEKKEITEKFYKKLKSFFEQTKEDIYKKIKEYESKPKLIIKEIEKKEKEIEKKFEPSSFFKKEELKPGIPVFINSIKEEGTLVSFEGEKVEVYVGNIKIKTNISDLRKPKFKRKEIQKISEISLFKAKNVSNKIDVHSYSVEEAILKIDKYLDDVSLTTLEKVTIIHGKGTGKLREAVHEYLKKHPSVESFRIGEIYEGGSGVTIVNLK
jgi:DNA mismatch repair protein MutS2